MHSLSNSILITAETTVIVNKKANIDYKITFEFDSISQFVITCMKHDDISIFSTQKGMLEGSTSNAKRMITESVEQCIAAIKNREKNLVAALDRDKRLSQEILNRQRERLISKRTALEKVWPRRIIML